MELALSGGCIHFVTKFAPFALYLKPLFLVWANLRSGDDGTPGSHLLASKELPEAESGAFSRLRK